MVRADALARNLHTPGVRDILPERVIRLQDYADACVLDGLLFLLCCQAGEPEQCRVSKPGIWGDSHMLGHSLPVQGPEQCFGLG